MRTHFASLLAVALGVTLGAGTALAGKTVLEEEFVGAVENRNKVGFDVGESPFEEGINGVVARIANSANSIAEGPPPGRSDSSACDPSATNAANDPKCFEDFAGDPVNRIQFDPRRCLQDEVPELLQDGGTDAIRVGCTGAGGTDFYKTGSQVKEAFKTAGALLVPGASSVNGFPVYQNVPTDIVTGQRGFAADYQWTMGLERPVVSDIQVQICLDVRRPQEEDDALGQDATIALREFWDHHGPEHPVLIRVVHHRGNLQLPAPQGNGPSRCPCEDRSLVDILNPTLQHVHHPVYPEDQLPDPGFVEVSEEILDESVAFIGKDCIVKTVKNDGFIAARDFITVQLKIPSTTRHRVRASQDSAALGYIGTPLPGETGL
ncbi:MAG: hypothetical protein OZ948_05425 [Deltaproteobacteria bacterium]|nr:hypothetical protein [Deltaproteobacteria bacterium]